MRERERERGTEHTSVVSLVVTPGPFDTVSCVAFRSWLETEPGGMRRMVKILHVLAELILVSGIQNTSELL